MRITGGGVGMDKIIKIFAVMIILFLVVLTKVYAAGTESSAWTSKEMGNKISVSLYDQGVEATKNKDFQKALKLFEQASRENKNNPDILNMLAHTQLKLGMIEESLASYNKALKIRPKFPEAREYLGEAYIQAALREIETLKSYGSEGSESLADLEKAFKEAAANL